MKHILLCLPLLAAAAFGQSAQPTPRKSPFTGFGNTSLDRKPGRMSTPVPNRPPMPQTYGGPSTPAPMPGLPGTPANSVPSAAASTSTALVPGGIALVKDWAGRVTQAAGGHTMKLRDLQFLLANYATPEPDLGPHPEITIYEGQRMDGAPGENCRITYLMPLREAEKQLLSNRGIATASKAVAPGFPDGLMLHTYDVRAGIYNRLTLVTDTARPENRVVSLLLKAETAHWYPPVPFVKIQRDWHTFDYVNAENRGQSGAVIDTRVSRQKGYIVVNTTGGFQPLEEIVPPGIVVKPARFSPKETTTWYLPEPLAKLILFCISQQIGAQ